MKVCRAALRGAVPFAGCVSSMLAQKIVAPPNKSGIKPLFSDWEILAHAPEAFAATWTVDVGPPAAKIAVAAVEPGDYGFTYDLQMEYADGKDPNIKRFDAYWRPARCARAARVPRHHPAAARLSAEPQLRRALGGAAGARPAIAAWWWICAVTARRPATTFPLAPSNRATCRRCSTTCSVAAGTSRAWACWASPTAASVALLTAGRDARVATVVAFEPFSSAERAVPELMRAAFAREAQGYHGPAIRGRTPEGGGIAGFELGRRRHSLRRWRARARRCCSCTAQADSWLSPDHSRELLETRARRAASWLSRRATTMCRCHCSSQTFAPPVIAWFERGLRTP